MTDDQIRALVADFYLALNSGARKKAHKIAGVLCREVTDPVEKVRWQKWRGATKRGHRVVIATSPVETLAGDALVAVDEARGFLGDDTRVAAAVEQLKEEA